MQIRKLIRLLSEEVNKNPRVAYMDACVDRDFVQNANEDFKYISIPDIGTRWCVWNAEESVNENQRQVMVLGTE